MPKRGAGSKWGERGRKRGRKKKKRAKKIEKTGSKEGLEKEMLKIWKFVSGTGSKREKERMVL